MSVTIELLQRQNRELREQLEERDETIRQLRAEMATPSVQELPAWLPHLTPSERRMLIALSDGRIHSRDDLLVELYTLEADHPSGNIIPVFISKLRTKLRGLLTIENVFAEGWRLTPESVALLRGEATLQSQSTNSVSGGTAQPSSRPVADVATGAGNRSLS